MTTFRDWQLQNQTCTHNAPQETRYIYTDFDSTNQRLNGAHTYTVTFAPGQTPPVDGFWSLTLYNKEHLFAPNSLGRYSLGTKSKSMKENPGRLAYHLRAEQLAADGKGDELDPSSAG